MTATKTLIEKIVLAEDVSSVTFFSIPNTYSDLLILCSVRSTRANATDLLELKLNLDNQDYIYVFLRGNGSAASADSGGIGAVIESTCNADSSTSDVFSSHIIYVAKYTSSAHKNVDISSVQENNATSAFIEHVAGIWQNTPAVNSVRIEPKTGPNWKTGSTFYLYGIQASPNTPILTQGTQTVNSTEVIISNYDSNLTYTASSSAGTASVSGNAITVSGLSVEQTVTVTVSAVDSNGYVSASASGSFVSAPIATGGTITESGGYRYHAFTTSGTFTLNQAKDIEVTMIAGGGGGGSASASSTRVYFGGGAGAGGLIQSSSLSLIANTYSAAVGSGGAAQTNGSNSDFSSLSAIGGGAGGSGSGGSGQLGGSGGGGGIYWSGSSATSGSGGAGTVGQGYAGGNAGNASYFRAAAGGGSSSAATNIVSNTASVPGSSTSIWGYSLGSGGQAGYTSSDNSGSNGANGAVNTGNGASGAYTQRSTVSRTGGVGGSGIIIIRYAI